ncbi:Phosphate transport system permease protein PstA [Arcticibacter svalbardensis MN12-7]|uniref:Phosphate transport system permease protein PstA n=1 Tax=Arcticibacter svalbardensis MN12-7 TaxID=1150600 RepID=R9GXN0_9SPHI|nr:phosphate ABC transporter permease PstA [Arcticibacter svalbardensis]EOR93704.1 Phosphate transport system permease protein PstA [Arcticibacter svalbardensis MN12-7]
MNKELFSANVKDKVFKIFAITCTGMALLTLLILIVDILIKGLSRINWSFFVNLPSRHPEQSGIYTALAGMVSLLFITLIIALPIGILSGIYLQEYGKRNKLAKFIEINISNLAGVPSVIYGILGLELFVRMAGFGNSILSGALTLALLIMPVIIVSTREAIKAVPDTMREAAFGLGATKLQTIWRVVLPASFGGILTGVILSISRAIGETAPLIVVGALAYVPFIPEGPMDQYTSLPIQIFNWTSRPQQGFIDNAAAGIIVLLVFTFLLNGIAVVLRNRWYRKTTA